MTTVASTPDRSPNGTPVPHHRVAIVGSGFGGIGAAIRLRQAGVADIVVFEKAGEVGGTWRDNTYPGCQCDVPSHLYSFSFAPNPDWTRAFAPQPEIQAYLRRVTDEYGVRPLVRTGHEVLDARWDDDRARWAIRTSAGDHTADILVSAHGGLSAPSVPATPGLDTFAGTVFHSAAWRHDHDLTGERVAVIGTGASAVQIIPKIQPDVGHLTVFQRTPGWVMPRMDHRIPDRRRALFRRFPLLQKLNRALQYGAREALVVVFVKRPALSHRLERGAHGHLARQVPDPDLRAKLTPSFTLGCKRILLSNHYYPALTRPNVDLVTAPISQVGPDGITTADGAHHPLDTIILATGFNATDHPMGHVIHGIGGQSLKDSWADGLRAYLGMTAPGFPNFFTLMGPNTGLGHSSIVFMLESQVNYVVDAVRQMDERDLAMVDVKPATAAAFDEEMQRRLAGSVWNTGGCSSWYLDENGRNPTMWPGFTFEYRRRTRRFDLAAYRARRGRPVGAPVAEAAPAPV